MDAILIILGYLIGAVPFALLLTRRVRGTDLRRVGSGNVGAANALRAASVPVGLGVMALDVGKGSAVVLLARVLGASDAALAATGVAAVVGHVYPVWLRFRGGKGVATACGVFALLAPGPTLLAAIAFTGVVWLTRYVSLGSMVAAVVLAAAVAIGGAPLPVVVAAVAAATLVLHRHRRNMVRLQAGSERRITQRV